MEDVLYDELWRTERNHWWFVGRRRIIGSLVDRFRKCPSGERLQICELGCGTGGNIADWASDHDVIGVDASEQALQYARRRLGSSAIWGKLPGDISLEPSSFDVVLLADVLEHVEQDAQSAQTAISLLRPNGILIATVPAYQWLYSARDRHHHHFRRYGKRQFQQLFAIDDVRIELLSFYNSLLLPVAATARLATKIIPARRSIGDLKIPPKPLNRMLTEIFAMDASMLSWATLPFGLSLIAVVRKTTGKNSARAA